MITKKTIAQDISKKVLYSINCIVIDEQTYLAQHIEYTNSKF